MDHLTLSERVARIENILVETGVAGDRNSAVQAQDAEFKRHFAQHEVERHFEQAQPSPKRDKIETTAFEEIIQRISSCNDRVCLTADKLQKIGDRIMGELPTNTEETSDVHRSPDGTLEHTFMALNWLDASLSRLEQVALRLERI